jgi:hypothetical protein
VTTKALSFTGTLTLQDILDLHHYRSLLVVRQSIRWLLAIFSLLIIAVVLVAGVQSHFSWPSYVILAVFVYFLFSCFGLDERLRVARHYRRHPDQYVESTVALSEDSVSVANINFDMRLRWKQLRTVVSTRRGLLFLLRPQQPLCWLPQRLFEGNSKKEQILDLARQQNVPVRELA